MPESLLERFRRGDRLALARLLTFAARGEHLDQTRAAVEPSVRSSRVIAVTGSAGVGKSTLIGKLITELRRQRQSVAVLACDPQSPLSGGALLGDRFRMPAAPDDAGVFIRSLAAAAGHGAVAEHLELMVQLLEAFGFDVILIETVGAGQGDTAVHGLADVVLLLQQPETGDDLQWEKAGLLEVADVIAIHKADLPGADQVEAQVRSMLSLSNKAPAPLVRVSSKNGQGLEALWSALAACPLRRRPTETSERALLERAQAALRDWFAAARSLPELRGLLAHWHHGAISDADAIAALFRCYHKSSSMLPQPGKDTASEPTAASIP
jgi:LAO/AO transport system ATPase